MSKLIFLLMVLQLCACCAHKKEHTDVKISHTICSSDGLAFITSVSG